jgi:hypothetical protein
MHTNFGQPESSTNYHRKTQLPARCAILRPKGNSANSFANLKLPTSLMPLPIFQPQNSDGPAFLTLRGAAILLGLHPNLGVSGIDRDAYLIGEDLTFETPAGRIQGGYDEAIGWSNEADVIMVAGDDLEFWRASDLSPVPVA